MMPMRRRRGLLLLMLLALSTIVLLGAAVLGLVQARQVPPTSTLEDGWHGPVAQAAFGLERQLLQLRGSIATYVAGRRDAGALEDLSLRHELLASRVQQLARLPGAQQLAVTPEHQRVQAQLRSLLRESERLLAARTPDVEQARQLLAQVDMLLGPVQRHTAVAAGLTTRVMEEQFQGMRRQTAAIGALAAVQVLLIIAVGWVLAGWHREQSEARHRAEQLALELSDAKLVAEEASRTKSQFLANMSHELRTPFQGVLGMLQLLRGTRLSERQEELVRTAQDSASHLLGILNDILDLSALQSGKMSVQPAPVDLLRLCRDVEAVMQVQAQSRGLSLLVTVTQGVPAWVEADAKRIKQILFNLINNGIKFTPQGEVRLEVRRLGTGADGRHLLRFEVVDTGIGMDKATQARLFRRFEPGDSSLSRPMGGAGLGLEISRSLAHLMGGELEACSELGKGSSFVLTLPLAPAPAQLELPLAELPPAAHRPLRVLVADDHPVNRRYLGLVLESLDHEPLFCANGQEVLETMRRERVDVVLMDIHMPVMDGLTATRALRAQGGAGAQVPVVALSADVLAGSRERALAAGCNLFLIKPVQIEALARALENAQHGGIAPATPLPLPASSAAPLSARFDEIAARLPREQLDELLAMFFADQSQVLAELDAGLQDADAEVVGGAAHKCKGSARLLGLDAVAAVAEAAEAWVRAGAPVAEAATLRQRLARALQASREAVAARQVTARPVQAELLAA